MNKQWIGIYLLVVYVHVSQQVSTPYSDTYIAAVVEYPPTFVENSAELTLKANVEAYVRHIKRAGSKGVDIIVFPEDGLTTVNFPEREKMESWTTLIPAVSDNYTPCTQNTIKVSKTLKDISCAAMESRVYVLINIAEKLPCTGSTCPKDKILYYNSNVAFDRTGKIIARYRKTNLFTEPQFNVTSTPEIVTFDTDFGVKFGTFICFDVLFDVPALRLTRILNVTDIVYPTAWFSEMPFLTAVQTQSGWSFAEDVNFLVAGYNRPNNGNAGSGIYLGRKGVGTAIFPTTKQEEMLIYPVPKVRERIRFNRHFTKNHDRTSYYYGKEHTKDELRKKREYTTANSISLKHEDIRNYETVLMDKNITKTVCHNNFCCDFKVEMVEIDPIIKYRLIVFHGYRRYVIRDAGVRTCGIISCSNDSVSSCGYAHESRTLFSNIEISTTFQDYKKILVMPSTLTSDLLPLKSSFWQYVDEVHDNHDVHVNMSLTNCTDNLLTFGLYSRFFDNNDASTTAPFHIIIYLIVLLKVGLYNMHV